MKRYTLLYYVVLALCLASCSENREEFIDSTSANMPKEIESTYPVGNQQTRASLENGFLCGDAVGIFVVDYDK